jgi:hypothetical protein
MFPFFTASTALPSDCQPMALRNSACLLLGIHFQKIEQLWKAIPLVASDDDDDDDDDDDVSAWRA